MPSLRTGAGSPSLTFKKAGNMPSTSTPRSTLVVQSRQVRAGVATPSSEFSCTHHTRIPNAYLWQSWIQGHPEFGFNFKALVCHDGVFDATYNGYSTDELFFVSDHATHPLRTSLDCLTTDTVQP